MKLLCSIASLGLASLGLASPAPAQPFGFTHRMLPVEADETQALALGDLDGDGDLDAFAGNDGPARVYRNDGSGGFSDVTATSLPLLSGDTREVALGDVDGDGDLDAFVGNNNQQNRLHLNDGTGTFTDVTATNLPVLIGATWAVALGDVDGDGDLDAFVGNNFQQNRLHLNDGTGVFADVTATNLPPMVTLTQDAALGDVDGDGDLDAYVGNSGQDRLYLNGGTGNFTDATTTNLPPSGDNTRSVALGDVDGDGDLDALAGNTGNNQDRLLLNLGTGIFADVTTAALPPLLDSTNSVALGDVDGDGDLDAFVGNWIQQSRLHLNLGTGVFADATATNLPARTDWTSALALGDVDGDGDLDALVGNSPQQDRLYLNAGGVFSDVTAVDLPEGLGDTRAVALGDVDGDGDLDAFVGNSLPFGDQQSRLYVNGGTGRFTDVTAANLPALLAVTVAIALGDVDGDGDLDAFLGNSGQQSLLYLNSGTGVFTDVTATNLPAFAAETRAVALGDVDVDGDLDAFVGQTPPFTTGDGRLLVNGGAGVFTDATANLLLQSHCS